jgi:hypothetical protein
MPEFRVLTALIPRVAAGTVLILIAGTSIAQNQGNGTFDRAMYLVILAIGFTVTAVFLNTRRATKFDIAFALVAAVGLVWGIWTIERPELINTGNWGGFGGRVALGTLVLLLLFGTVLRPHHFSQRVRVVLGLLVGVCCLFDLFAAIRTFDSMIYVSNNLVEINDMLGPVAGKAPDSNFIPQYVVLYGWLFVPLQHVLSPTAMVGAISDFLTALDIATALLAVWLVSRFLGTNTLLLALAIVLPITYITSAVGGAGSSIASLFQELPVRLLAGFTIAAVGISDLLCVYRGIQRTGRLILIGVVCALASWNSQDFGLAAAVVYGFMLLVCATPTVRLRAVVAWFGGVAIGGMAYPLFLLAVGSPLNVGYVAEYVKYFGSGLGSAPIQVPGPVLIVVPIVVCSATAGWALTRLRRRADRRDDALLDRATMTLTFVGTWATICALYYVNRAYAAGQLQSLLLPCGVCIAALLSILIRTPEAYAVFEPKEERRGWDWLSPRIRMAPVGIFVCLSFASLLRTPNPVSTANALFGSSTQNSYGTYDIPQIVDAVNAAKRRAAGEGGSLTYLGESFNYVSLVTHVPSNTLLFPFQYPPASQAGDLTRIDCQYLGAHPSTWIVLSLDALGGFGPDVCGMYHPVALPGFAKGQLQELK